MLRHRWTCSCCGREQTELPHAWGCGPPLPYLMIPEWERFSRAGLNADHCVADGRDFFRGCLEIPIEGQREPLIWNVWISLSEAHSDLVIEAWDMPGREALGPFPGHLVTEVPLYPDSLGLEAELRIRRVGLAPTIHLPPSGHLLAIEQSEGIALARVIEIAEALLPRH